MANVGSPEWDHYVAEYVAALKEAEANGMKGWEHANCDHANGYCAEAADSRYRSREERAEQEAREADAWAWAQHVSADGFYFDEA